MPEIDEIRKRKLAEMQARANSQSSGQQEADEEAAIMQQIQKMEDMVRPYLSKDALQRYSNLKLAHPEQAVKVLLVLMHGIQAGKLGAVTDEQLKSLLRDFMPKRHETKIVRK